MTRWNLCSVCGAFWSWNQKGDVGPLCVAWGSAPMPDWATPGYRATVERLRRNLTAPRSGAPVPPEGVSEPA